MALHPAPCRENTGLKGVCTRPARLPHPWGATSCREAAPLNLLMAPKPKACRFPEPKIRHQPNSGGVTNLRVLVVHQPCVVDGVAGALPRAARLRDHLLHHNAHPARPRWIRAAVRGARYVCERMASVG